MPPPRLALTVLGSGGATASPRRASSGYLVEIDGAPSVLVDAGGGVLERLGRRGADPARIEAILLTRLHAEHSGEMAPVLLAAYAGGRRDGMLVMGPAGRPGATGACRFVDLLFGERGAWRDLRDHTGFALDVCECPAAENAAPCAPRAVAGVIVRSAPAPHGAALAVAYRVEHAGCSLVIGGDVASEGERLVELAAGCDVLVCGFGPAGEVGRMAAASRCGLLVLSHLTPEDEAQLADTLARVRRQYDGPLAVAEDLMTLRVGGNPARGTGGEPSGVTGVPV